MDIEKFVRKVVEDNKDREMSHFAFGVRLLETYESLFPNNRGSFYRYPNEKILKDSARPYPDME